MVQPQAKDCWQAPVPLSMPPRPSRGKEGPSSGGISKRVTSTFFSHFHFTWAKGLCRWDQVKDLKTEDSPGLSRGGVTGK